MNDQNFGENVNIPIVPPMDGTAVAVDLTDETIAHETPISINVESSSALLNLDESEQFRTRCIEIQGNDVSNEELRRTLQHYRSFFNSLVSKKEE